MSKETIFITGATGFIGCQVAATSLAAGYRVRLSVRKQEQIQRLKEILPNSADDVEFVVIPDITKTQSFDSALDGVAYVFHIASPMPGKADDLHTGYIEPAVQGTTAVLDAALTKPGIRKVIVMASIMALATLTLFMDGIPALVQGRFPSWPRHVWHRVLTAYKPIPERESSSILTSPSLREAPGQELITKSPRSSLTRLPATG